MKIVNISVSFYFNLYTCFIPRFAWINPRSDLNEATIVLKGNLTCKP